MFLLGQLRPRSRPGLQGIRELGQFGQLERQGLKPGCSGLSLRSGAGHRPLVEAPPGG